MLKKKDSIAISAIQDLIIEARRMAYENYSTTEIAEFLDGIEYLPALILEDEDNTELFESYLRDFCRKFQCINVFDKYNMTN